MFKFFGLMPVFPSLIIFGFGILFLHYGKKQKSRWLKIGGYFLSIASIILMLIAVYFFITKPCGHYKGKHGCGMGPMGDDYDMGFRHQRHMQYMMDNRIGEEPNK